MKLWRMAVSLLVLGAVSNVQAHVTGEAVGFSDAFLHPFMGLDHLLAMIAVGLWAAQMGRQALWFVPSAFVGMMTVGSLLGFTGFGLPFVESGIASSVLVLGLLLALQVRLPVILSACLVGAFALFHGQAHGTELLQTAFAVENVVGFTLATALLHGVGMGLGWFVLQWHQGVVLRVCGVGLAGVGLWLSVGVFA